MTRMPRDPAIGARHGWLLEELASAGRENLDAAHVARYDAKEDAGAGEEVSLCRALGLGEGSTVIDIGAGTGQFAIAAAPVCARVIAVDVSGVMLERLRAKLAGAGVTNVELAHAGFLSYRHRDEPADFIYSRYALHHLPDFWKAIALRRMRGMLRAGGVLRLSDVVYSFDLLDAEDRLEAWCASGGLDAERGWSRTELEEHVRDEHSTFSWLLEPMIARSGFEVEDAVYSDDGIFARYVLRAV
jgi:ubiquinone/menaquinone biosynthesis C-methylase UbiE